MTFNYTFVVASVYECSNISYDLSVYRPDPFWRTTALGCELLKVLQDMYHFKTKNVYGYMLYDPLDPKDVNYEYPPDIYAKPLPLTAGSFGLGYPLQSVIDRRYGFILSQPPISRMRPYYSLPFETKTWEVMCLIIGLMTLILYLLSRWEKRVVRARQEYTFTYELMVVLGAAFQHIPPVNPILPSRRIAYLTFFFFCYLTYTFYTSNLLSHLVNDRDNKMTLENLVTSSYQFITLDNLRLTPTIKTFKQAISIINFKQMGLLKNKFYGIRFMNISAALKALSTESVALLSDYITVYPSMKNDLDDEVICTLTEIDLIRNIKEFMFISKTFPLKEEFKIGLMRIMETGLLKRIKHVNVYSAPECQYAQKMTFACLDVVGYPLIILAASFLVSAIILVVERIYFDRTRVWPFVN